MRDGVLERKLDLLLEGVASPVLLRAATTAAHRLDNMRRQVIHFETELARAIDRVNGDFAMLIRRRHPSLSVALSKDGCKVSYKSKWLLFPPDVRTRVWRVSAADPRFERAWRSGDVDLTLTDDNAGLADSVAKFFVDHYRSLQEDVVGAGVLVVDGRRASLLDVGRWVNRRHANFAGARR